MELAAPRLIVLFLVSLSNLSPQVSTASLGGTLRDSSNAVIPGAKLTDTNFKFETTANATGIFFFPGVVPGPYLLLEAAAPGMAPRATLSL